MRIIKIAKREEYMIENGILYNENGDDVFSIKELLLYSVPLFKTPEEANSFLSDLEKQTKKSWGRVDERDYLTEIRYKDTKKEKHEEKMRDWKDRNQYLQKGTIID